jgi:hypothetical protein
MRRASLPFMAYDLHVATTQRRATKAEATLENFSMPLSVLFRIARVGGVWCTVQKAHWSKD